MKNLILENFRKLSKYDNKLTLSENLEIINEGGMGDFFKEMVSLFRSEGEFRNELNSLTAEIKDLNGVRMSGDEILRQIKNGTLPKESYKEVIKSLFREATSQTIKSGIAKEIVSSSKTKSLFETLTKDQILEKIKKKGYASGDAEYIFNTYRQEGGKYIKPSKISSNIKLDFETEWTKIKAEDDIYKLFSKYPDAEAKIKPWIENKVKLGQSFETMGPEAIKSQIKSIVTPLVKPSILGKVLNVFDVLISKKGGKTLAGIIIGGILMGAWTISEVWDYIKSRANGSSSTPVNTPNTPPSNNKGGTLTSNDY